MNPVNIPAKFEVRSFTRSWMGYWKNLGHPWICPCTLPFLQIFHQFMFGWTLWMYRPNLQSVSSWDNSDCSFGVGCEPQSWGRGGRRGSGMVPFERAFVTSYRFSIVTFPLSLRISEILPLLCSSTKLSPTTPLVSPIFPRVPLGVGGWPLGYEERRCWASCPCS